MSASQFRETAIPRREAPRPGRPSELPAACRQQITAFLAAEPRMKGAEVLRRLRSEHGYRKIDGSKGYVHPAKPVETYGPV